MKMKTTSEIYENVYLKVERYAIDDSIAIHAYNQQVGPIATLTVCLGNTCLKQDEAYIDTNNYPWAIDFIEQEGLGQRTGQIGQSGFCSYPVVKFNMDEVNKKRREK